MSFKRIPSSLRDGIQLESGRFSDCEDENVKVNGLYLDVVGLILLVGIVVQG